jgi:hypothetical protein
MSLFVIASPDALALASEDLAGIGSSIRSANFAAARSTTQIAAAAQDEVSAAIAALFGAHGQAYQAMSAEAAAFHSEFVNLMNAGAGAYLSTEIANAEQALTNAVGAPQALLGGGASLGSMLSGAARLPAAQTGFTVSLIPGLLGAGTSGTGSTDFVGPYVTFVENTFANLQSLGANWLADPFPFLRQVIANQIGYAHLVATAHPMSSPHSPNPASRSELSLTPATCRSALLIRRSRSIWGCRWRSALTR